MACIAIQNLPAGSTILTGSEPFPGVDSVGVTRKYLAAHIALSAVEFDDTLQYPTGARVWGTDQNIYRARTNTTGDFPELSPTQWALESINVDTTINVPSILATLADAMEYIHGTVIQEDAVLIIQLADGSYNYTTSQIDLSHPYGNRIVIQGNIGSPASCDISFSGLDDGPTSPYLRFNSANLFATGYSGITINGFSILKTGGVPSFGHCAILASNGATINVGPNMIINGFWANIASFNNGNVIAGDASGGLALVTTASNYAIYSDGGIVTAATSTITGPGNAVFAEREAVVNVREATIDLAIVNALTLNGAHAIATDSIIGAVDILIFATGASSADTTGATIGVPTVAFIRLDGQLVYNDTTLVGNSADIASANIQAGTVQHGGAANATVFLETGGIDTLNTALALQANNTTGVGIATTGAVTIPVSLALGATAVHTGLQGGSGVLDAAGVLTVIATWVTANTVIVPEFNDATATGPRLQSAITPVTSFTLTSGAGAGDVGKAVNWIAIVYP